jgi:two-component system, NtrC family, nitrogen regulation response regulator NtrX
MSETVLVVDDEDGVRKTFTEWLGGLTGVTVLAAADAEAALLLANEHPIDLAILDWNLGSGMDGLRLLEDLAVFLPDIVAILITGYANQATPLDALRLGVRDYFDKNQNLTREVFLKAVRTQLDKIAPAKRQRQLNAKLHEFRTTLEQVLPLVQSSATLNDPVPLPTAIQSVFRFLMRTTQAKAGALVIRAVQPDGTETITAYQHDGQRLTCEAIPYRSSLAATVLGLNQPSVLTNFTGVALQPFEQNRSAILLAPLGVAPGVQAVLELYDAPDFTDDHKRTVSSVTDIAAELLRQSLAQRQSNDLLYGAVDAALKASHSVTDSLGTTAPVVMDQLRQTMQQNPNAVAEAGVSLRLLEAVRELGVRHGEPAIQHCVTLVESVRSLLDQSAGL